MSKILCKLHSMEDDTHTHSQPLVECDLVEIKDGVHYVVKTPQGITCTAINNPFAGVVFADDKYGIISVDPQKDAPKRAKKNEDYER